MIMAFFGCIFYLFAFWLILILNRNFNGVTVAIFAWGLSLVGSLQIFNITGHSYTIFVIGLGAFSLAIGTLIISILSGFESKRENLKWILKDPEVDSNKKLYKLFLIIITFISTLFFIASVYFFVVPGKEFLFSANSRPLLRDLPNAGYFIRSYEIALPSFAAFFGLDNIF